MLACQISELMLKSVTNPAQYHGFFLLLLYAKNWHELCIVITKEEEMVALTRNEIIDELMKLGINSPAEVQDYSMEYMIYYKVKCLKLN